jgi:hypothetical protein
MSEMTKRLARDDKRDEVRSLGLWGMGGSGKSQVALRYAEQNRDRFGTVIWINAESPASAAESFARAFEALNLEYPVNLLDEVRRPSRNLRPDYTTLQRSWAVKLVLGWLERRYEAGCEWLVILDNADALFWTQDIMPRGKWGTVIVTSRDKMVRGFVESTLEVGALDTDEAIDLLLHGVGPPDSPDWDAIPSDDTHSPDSTEDSETPSSSSALEPPFGLTTKPRWRLQQEQEALPVVQILGNLALAVGLANAYIIQHDHIRENITMYLDYHSSSSFAVLQTPSLMAELRDPYRFLLSAVFETSFTSINSTNPTSIHLLYLLAHLSSASIQDRLFKEASVTLLTASQYHSTYNPVLYTLKLLATYLGTFFGLRFIIWLLILYKKPNLSADKLKLTQRIMTVAPLIVDNIYAFVLYKIAQSEVSTGEVVTRAGEVDLSTICLMIYMGFSYNLPYFSEWLLDGNVPFLRLKVLPYTMSTLVLFSWLWASFYYGLDTLVESHTKLLLDQLNLSTVNNHHFQAMLEGLHALSRQTVGILFPIEMAWLLVLRTILNLVNLAIFVLIYVGWETLITGAIIPWVERWSPSWGRKIFLFFLRVVRGPVGAHLLALGIGMLCGYLYQITGTWNWLPWRNSGVPQHSVNSTITNTMLSSNDADIWDSRPYMEAMAPLVRFSLVHRSATQGYYIHPLVEWSVRQRLEAIDGFAWVKEADRFLNLAYQSDGCWKDVFCQQMLIPHLVDVANAGIQYDGMQYWRLKSLLRLLYRSLKKIGGIE